MAGVCEQVQYNSQASQDKFVNTLLYDLLGKNDPGYYLEIGAAHPIEINNTFYFEKKYGWTGVSIDISSYCEPSWKATRINPLRIEDATESPYSAILADFPVSIDYLSLDVDGFYDVVLEMLPHQNHIFKVITIEHDFYRYGNLYRDNERQILSSLGYYRLCGDVSNTGLAFEDWWIHPSAFPSEILAELSSLELDGKDHTYIINTIKKHFNLIK